MNDLILFHDSTGKVDALVPLVSHLDSSVRVLGLERRFCPVVPKSLEELTAYYLERVSAIRHTSPWCLAGWSFGGILAYEVARQLIMRGEQVVFLGVIDAEPPVWRNWSQLYQDSMDAIRQIISAGKSCVTNLDAWTEALAKLDHPYGFIAAKLPTCIGDAVPLDERLDASRYSYALATILEYVSLLATYRPNTLRGGVMHFECFASDEAIFDGWRQWMVGLSSYHKLIGNHRSILNLPEVKRIADTYNNFFNMIERRQHAEGNILLNS